ncbi:MAG: hypothetical protein GF355_14580 [Candidatus Eisenbacteria bacterium]|nr:hypothetical protein [Candidatus Eisenbacteria bacterium]
MTSSFDPGPDHSEQDPFGAGRSASIPGGFDPEHPDSGRNVVVIRKESDPALARLLETFLTDQGVPCRVAERLQTRGGIFAIQPYPLLLHELIVFEEDAERARFLINEFLTAEAEGENDPRDR